MVCPYKILLLRFAGQDERYLLTFKAYPHHERKERNLYELASRIVGFADHHGPFRESYGADTATSEPGDRGMSMRYGVRSVVRVKVLNRSNSDESPKSVHNGVYVLVYDPIYTICAKSYSIAGGKINYDDYASGTQYEFPVRHRRRFAIYEVQVVSPNILPELWMRLMKKPTERSLQTSGADHISFSLATVQTRRAAYSRRKQLSRGSVC